MPILKPTPVPWHHPLFPGEALLTIGSVPRPGRSRMTMPGGVSLHLRRFNPRVPTRPTAKCTKTNTWEPNIDPGKSVFLTLWPADPQQGMTPDRLTDALPDLTGFLGPDLAAELTGHAAGLLNTFSPGGPRLARNLEFVNLAHGHDFWVQLREHYSVQGDGSFSRRVALGELLRMWTSPASGAAVYQALYDRTRARRSGTHQATLEAEAAAFRSLAERSESILRRQLAEL